MVDNSFFEDTCIRRPCRVAYLFYRSLCRFFGSIFFPMLRKWGELGLSKNPGKIWVALDRGFPGWMTVLRVFSSPVVFFVSEKRGAVWEKIVEAGGMKIHAATGDREKDARFLQDTSSQCHVVVFLNDSCQQYFEQVLHAIKNSTGFLYLAISGIENALSGNSIIPEVCQINVFGGLPVSDPRVESSIYDDLKFLEWAIRDVPLGDTPSIFFNHLRNQKST